jgi:hypothetical protein
MAKTAELSFSRAGQTRGRIKSSLHSIKRINNFELNVGEQRRAPKWSRRAKLPASASASAGLIAKRARAQAPRTNELQNG